jgi:hypothetical protein
MANKKTALSVYGNILKILIMSLVCGLVKLWDLFAKQFSRFIKKRANERFSKVINEVPLSMP